MGRKSITLIAAVVVAALGAALVFLYVQGVDDRAQADAEPVQVLTAVAQVDTGETVADAQAAGKLELTEIPGAAVLPGALTDTESIKDAVALAPVYEGEQIIASRFGTSTVSASRIDIPDKEMAISIQLGDPERVAGFVSPGSKVAIFATLGAECGTGGGGGVTTESGVRLLMREVTVIGVGQTGSAATTTTTTDATGAETVEAIPATILTLALDQADSERMILASKTTCLTLALLTDKSRVTPTNGTVATDLFSGS
jgi:pilus assembly protein CpaB